MVRGYITFVCDDCGNRFRALDIEYAASILSMPAVCPSCQSRHTYPWSLFGLNKSIYKRIWKSLEEERLDKN